MCLEIKLIRRIEEKKEVLSSMFIDALKKHILHTLDEMALYYDDIEDCPPNIIINDFLDEDKEFWIKFTIELAKIIRKVLIESYKP